MTNTNTKGLGARVLLLALIACVVFVFSGLGVFAFPEPAQAGWPSTTIADLDKLIENILIAVWKLAIYPLLKNIFMSLASGSDWMMTSEQFAQWLLKDVVFQAANVIFKKITGFSLCVNLNLNLQIALTKFVKEDYTPDCKYEHSKIVKLLTQDPAESMDELRKKMPEMLDASVSGSNNDIGLSLDAAMDIFDESSKKSTTAEDELFSGKGLFSTRDCSINAAQAKEYGESLTWIDSDKDGMVDKSMRPDHCRKTSVEGQLAEAIKKNDGASGDVLGQTLKSQMLLDVIAIGKMALGQAIETYALDPLKKWLADYLLDAGSETSTAVAPSYSSTGENRLIEFPSSVQTPTGVTPPPNLSDATKNSN